MDVHTTSPLNYRHWSASPEVWAGVAEDRKYRVINLLHACMHPQEALELLLLLLLMPQRHLLCICRLQLQQLALRWKLAMICAGAGTH